MTQPPSTSTRSNANRDTGIPPRCQRRKARGHHHRRPRQSRRRSLTLAAAGGVVALTTLVNVVNAEQNLTSAQVDIVVRRMNESSTRSWEVGTAQQALIELTTPSFSVLNNSFIPPSSSLPSSLAPVIHSITSVIQNKTILLQSANESSRTSTGTTSAPQPFWPEDGSAADPASNGVAALIANWTGQEGVSGVDYDEPAREQMEFLWEKVPRTEDGALSHRVSEVQLWSDFVYMVPPFLAYYGVLTQNRSMLEEAYNQISLYRHYLRDSRTRNLWRHVVMGNDFDDQGFWSTGNAWAAAGMLRVLGTIQNSQYANAMKGEVKDLRKWVNEIHDGMYFYMRDDGLFHNYANDSSTFADASSAALLASTVYRHALLTRTYHHLPQAEFVRRALWAPSSSSPSANYSQDPQGQFSQNTSFVDPNSLQNMTHFNSDGWLTPVVNPHSFGEEGSESPEGQAFVVMMYSAWRDWVDEGAVGANAARRVRGDVPSVAGVWMSVGCVVGAGVVLGWGFGI